MKIRGAVVGFILFAVVAVGISFNGCGGKATGADGTVVAEFEWDGKHHITLEEILREIEELPRYQKRKYQEKEGIEEYVTLMAESRLILCLAKDEKLEENPEILKKVQDYLHELMVEKITELEVDEKLRLTEEDYRLYYEANKSTYVEPEQVRLTCISLGSEKRAQEILQQIKNGEDMAKTARKLSDKQELVGPAADPLTPGDTGYFTRNAYSDASVKPFRDKAFAMEVGEMTEDIFHVEVIASDMVQPYYMIFRKEGHIEEHQLAFEEEDVRQNVEKRAEQEKREALMRDWVAQLRERAKVKTFVDLIPETPKEGMAPEDQSQ